MSDGHVRDKLAGSAEGRLNQEINFAASDGVAKPVAKLQSAVYDDISSQSTKGFTRPLGSLSHLLEKLKGAASRVLGEKVATRDVIIFVKQQFTSWRVAFGTEGKGLEIMRHAIQGRLVVGVRWPPGLAGTRLTVEALREDPAFSPRAAGIETRDAQLKAATGFRAVDNIARVADDGGQAKKGTDTTTEQVAVNPVETGNIRCLEDARGFRSQLRDDCGGGLALSRRGCVSFG